MRAFLSLCGALALLSLIVAGCSEKTTTGPSLPRVPSNPSPANGDSVFMTDIYLAWDCSHPEGKVLSYDVYFDTTSPPIIYRTHHWNDSLLVDELRRGMTYFWKIVALDENYNTTSGPIWSFVVGSLRDFPSDPPTSPRPADGDTNISINENLSWACIDSGGEQLSFDIYLGIDSLPPLVAARRYGNNYDPGTLLENAVYFWKIAAEDSSGHRTEGPVWHFTTGTVVNQPPSVPWGPSPANSAIDFPPYYGVLRWSCSDPENDLLTYGLYLGTSNPPPFEQNLTSNFYDPPNGGNFEVGAAYYWKIIATDAAGNVTEGPIWTFNTWPANMTPMGNLETGQNCFDIALYGNYAFVGSTDGLSVINISNPASPTYITGISLDIPYVTVDGNYVYASGSPGFLILNVTDPTSPQTVGSLASIRGHISINGNIACVARNQLGLVIIDISDRAHPTVLGEISTDDAYDVDIDGSYAYVADEHTGLKVIDISTPSNPILVGSLDTGTLMAIAVSGSYAYVADDYTGMQMINISNPRQPRLYQTISVAGGTREVEIAGNYAYFETGNGHLVADISDPASVHLVGTFREIPHYILANCIIGAGNLVYLTYPADNSGPEFSVFRLGP